MVFSPDSDLNYFVRQNGDEEEVNIILAILRFTLIWPLIFILRAVNWFLPRTMHDFLSKTSDVCPMTYEESKAMEQRANELTKPK